MCHSHNHAIYKNPVLCADYSDPDAIRAGDDYWMTSSSFCHVPGLPILHSRDLVNWTLVNHALPALVPRDYYSTVRHGQGVWAPSIRHHAGKFWIYYPDPDFGLHVITAANPRGAWSEPTCVKAGKGLIDPCPFWDDDGRAWLAHAWAKSRAGISSILTLHRLADDGLRVADEGRVIIDGNALPGHQWLEGPKIYKRNGWYYIFAPAGGVTTGFQAVFRSRAITGPYENRIVLEQGGTRINGPHQGAWVDTPSGEHWFLHFQEIPALGRVVHLQPMRWENDWPLMGTAAAGGDGTAPGNPILTHKNPAVARQPAAAPATSDNFSAPALGLQWQWQANPRSEWARVDASQKTLFLAFMPMSPDAPGSHWMTPHLFMQKFPCADFCADVAIDFPAAQAREGDHAGLMIFGYDYAWLGLVRAPGGNLRLVLATCHYAQEGTPERISASHALDAPATGGLRLRVEVSNGRDCRFSHSADGKTYTPIGDVFQAASSKWVGAKVGLFAASASEAAGEPRHAAFQDFCVKEAGK